MSNNVYANEADALEMARPAHNETDEAPTLADFPGSTPGPWRQCAPEINGKADPIYRKIEGGDGCGHAGYGYRGFVVTGYIHESDARLLAAAPDLLELAKQYASECGECGGTGRSLHKPPAVDQRLYGTCPDCADIRAVIDKATLPEGDSHRE